MIETSKIKNLLTSELNSMLFEYYITRNNKAVYNDINKYSKDHIVRINSSISEEGYVIQEKTLELIKNFKITIWKIQDCYPRYKSI